MMYLIQVLLPLEDESGTQFPSARYERLNREFTEKFGGVTAYSRSPAQGRWKDGSDTHHDDIVVLEVMAQKIDRGWWAALRTRLEEEVRQEEVIIRAQKMEQL